MKNLVTALIFTFATTVWAGDYKTAFSFYKKAADQGELAAQFNVGLYYCPTSACVRQIGVLD